MGCTTFYDISSLIIAFSTRKIAGRPADEDMTFGYGRIEIVAAPINYTTLILVGFYPIIERQRHCVSNAPRIT